MKGTTRGRMSGRITGAPSRWLVAGAVTAVTCGLVLATGPAGAAQETAAQETGGQATAGQRAPAAPCVSDQLIANSAERIGGSSQVRITVINDGPEACVLRGFPTVALAGQGSPDRNRP